MPHRTGRGGRAGGFAPASRTRRTGGFAPVQRRTRRTTRPTARPIKMTRRRGLRVL